MKRIFFIFTIFSIISLSPIFAEDSSKSESNSSENSENKAGADSAEAFAIIPELEAEETKDVPSGKSKAIFKTNVKSCMIYINGNNQGRSNLTLSNLIEGYYLLRVEKDGYKTQENFVYIENGKAKTFYVELQMDEETQKRMDARQERAAAREAEKAAKEAAKAEEKNAAAQESQFSSDSVDSAAFGDAK